MTNSEAKKILERLVLGKHPKTGADLLADGLLVDREVVLALRTATVALAKTQEMARALAQIRRREPYSGAHSEQSMHPRAGFPWTADEVRLLLEAFDTGVSVSNLVSAHGRSMLGIASRLVAEGRDCKLSELVRANLRPKPARKTLHGPQELPI